MLEHIRIHGDQDGMTADWSFRGDSRANTDHGRLYVAIVENGADRTVTVYRDAERTSAVATGTLSGASSGSVALQESNQSGLTGSVALRNAAANASLELDVFHADDDDLRALRADIDGFLEAGEFAGEAGFTVVRRRASRYLDLLLAARGFARSKIVDLRPLSDAAAHFAVAFLFDHLSTREGDPASVLARAYRLQGAGILTLARIETEAGEAAPFLTRPARG